MYIPKLTNEEISILVLSYRECRGYIPACCRVYTKLLFQMMGYTFLSVYRKIKTQWSHGRVDVLISAIGMVLFQSGTEAVRYLCTVPTSEPQVN